MENSNTYFAAQEAEKVASVCLSRSETFFNTLRSNAYIQKILNNWRAYHGAYQNDVGFGHQIQFTGEQGELTSIPINHFRNLAQHMLNMITSNRPSVQARALNTDYKSLSQAYLATGILDYYLRQKDFEKYLHKACESAIVLGTGFVKMEWNATSGEMYDFDPETGEANYEGEIEFTNPSVLDVVTDGTKDTWDNDWVIVRSFKNRFNIAAKFPELAQKIIGLPTKSESSVYRLAVFSNDETDDIPVYEFFHRKTEAMPEGRYMVFLDSNIVLLDTKLPYREIPVYRIVPSEILGTPYGYTSMFDVYPIQEAINSTHSAILSNQNAFAVQNVYVPRGADISVAALSGGLNVVEGNAKPEALNLTQTPQEVFAYLEKLVQDAETISGVNSVTRGNPEASLKSGTALALVQSMSLQFLSGLQQSYVKLIENTCGSLINILKDYATTPKVIALVGKNNRPYLKEFKGDDIQDISRVVVDMGNPLSKTAAGRVQMAEQMMQMGVIRSPQEYIQVITTGSLDVMYEGDQAELLLIKQENEKLLSGAVPLVSPMDAHKMHIIEHKAVLADPDLRENPALVKAVMEHIQMHMDALRNTDPDLLALINEQPLSPQPNSINPQQPNIPNDKSLERSNNSDLMQAPIQGGPVLGQEAIQNPNLPGGEQNLPNLPTVDANLLPNPGLQEQSLNNVR